MSTSLREEFYSAKVGLSSRPASIPTLLLTSWRVPVVVLLIAACRQRRAKREQLVVLNWAVRDEAAFAALKGLLEKQDRTSLAPVRYEPALVRATNIAHGLGLLVEEGGWLQLTPDADILLSEIAEVGAYALEREVLGRLPAAVSLSAAQAMLKGGAR
jgi:hypothetical protein